MKSTGFALALLCAVAFAAAQSEIAGELDESFRVRREADPQGSIVLEGSKPMGGPDRRPTINLNYQHRIYDKNGMTADAFGGMNKSPGLPIIPHGGLKVEKNYRNGFIRGHSDMLRLPGGRITPNIGIGGGFRFRRDVDNVEEEQGEEQAVEQQESSRVRRQTDPKGSVVLDVKKPIDGPERRPTINLDYQHRFYEKNGMSANAYGGMNKSPGLPVIPHGGLSVEKKYGNGFIRGYGDMQRLPGGRFTPNIGIGGGFRFRRDVDNVEEEQGEEQAVEEQESSRVRREADPQGSIVLEGTKPMGGPDRRPTINLDYQHRIYDKNGMTADAFGGMNKSPGLPIIPHGGLKVEKNYGNGFIRGYGDMQRLPGGRFTPNVGIGGGFRFRRDVDNVEEEQGEEQAVEEQESSRVRRQTDPKGSVALDVKKPIDGPERRPTVNLDYEHRFYEKNGMSANAYGGMNKSPGLPVIPHGGLSVEKKYGNGFIRGYGDMQRLPGGRFTPNFGIGGGFRFRRDVDNVEQEQGEEHVIEGQEHEY